MTPTPRRWRPSPLIVASGCLHVGAGIAAIAVPGTWPIALSAVALDHLALTAAGLWPRSTALGPNMLDLPQASGARNEIAITLDDGPDREVTPRALDILDAYHAQATFFVIGEFARANASLCREIVRRGHSIQNHSQHHRHNFSLHGPRAFKREISAAQATIADIVGTPPAFFRAPAGLRNPFLEPVLAELGLTLTSWTRRGFDTVRRDPQHVLQRLAPAVRPGAILLLHDGHAARSSEGEPIVLAVLPRLLALCQDRALKPVTLDRAML